MRSCHLDYCSRPSRNTCGRSRPGQAHSSEQRDYFPLTLHNPIMQTSALHAKSDRVALRATHLRKVYGSVTALDDVSFTVNPGEIVGLLGPNGAGKTTTISMVLGVLAATTGSVEIDGIDISKERAKALARTNFAAVYATLPGNLTVIENLRFFGLLYSIEALPIRVEELLQEFELAHLRHTKCGLLSSGEQTRAALAKALLNKPQLLLLDEPTASLDPSAAQLIRAKIRSLATEDRCGILWTSHNMIEVEAVCDRVLFLSRGKVLLEGDPRTLPREHGSATLEDLFIRVAREPLASAADTAL
jgi:ABC-2 type transport system ATP-binding protein